MFSSLGKHFTLSYSNNKHKMFVGNWSNVEEKEALGACPHKIFIATPSRMSEHAPFKSRI